MLIHIKVVVYPLVYGAGLYVEHYYQIALLSAVAAAVALVAYSHARTPVHTRGNVEGLAHFTPYVTASAAGLALVRDDPALAAAVTAHRAHGLRSEHGALGLGDVTAAVAVRAHFDGTGVLGAAAVAVGTFVVAVELDRLFHAEVRFVESERDLQGNIVAVDGRVGITPARTAETAEDGA